MGRGTTLGVYLKAISSSGSLLLLLLLHLQEGIIVGASSASAIPATEQKCDKVVSVETRELLSYLGNVTFVVPKNFSGRWTTVIKFTSPYTFIGGWGVEVQSFGQKAYAIFKRFDQDDLKAGDQVIFQFRVLYGLRAKVPKVLSMRWENSTICGPLQEIESNSNAHSHHHQLNEPVVLQLESSEETEEEMISESSEEDHSDVIQRHIFANKVRL